MRPSSSVGIYNQEIEQPNDKSWIETIPIAAVLILHGTAAFFATGVAPMLYLIQGIFLMGIIETASMAHNNVSYIDKVLPSNRQDKLLSEKFE